MSKWEMLLLDYKLLLGALSVCVLLCGLLGLRAWAYY